MKRTSLILALLLLLCSFTLLAVACTEKYQLTVIDQSNLLVEPLKNSYKAGETVIVKVNILMDADVIAYLDEQDLGKYEVIETNGKYTHWEFHFTMPNHDATLTFEIKDGFLPNEENEYNLTVIDPSNLLVEPLKESYKAGEIVTVKVDILIDAYVVVYIDGQPCEEKITDGESYYWEFYFTMPDHDATLTFEIKDGFLPNEGDEYKLTVIDPSKLLIEPLKNSYQAGETVIVKVSILMDADVIAYLDGQNIGKYEVIETNGKYTHWEFHFTMPDHDATLTFETKDGFLP